MMFEKLIFNLLLTDLYINNFYLIISIVTSFRAW